MQCRKRFQRRANAAIKRCGRRGGADQDARQREAAAVRRPEGPRLGHRAAHTAAPAVQGQHRRQQDDRRRRRRSPSVLRDPLKGFFAGAAARHPAAAAPIGH